MSCLAVQAVIADSFSENTDDLKSVTRGTGTDNGSVTRSLANTPVDNRSGRGHSPVDDDAVARGDPVPDDPVVAEFAAARAQMDVEDGAARAGSGAGHLQR